MTYDWIAEEVYIIFYKSYNSFFNRLTVYSLPTRYSGIDLVYDTLSDISDSTEIEMTFNPFEK